MVLVLVRSLFRICCMILRALGDDLAARPEREVDNEIEIEKNAKPPHGGM